jgi:hypothetical protein
LSGVLVLFASAAVLAGLTVAGRCVRSLADSVDALEQQRASLETRIRVSGKRNAPE